MSPLYSYTPYIWPMLVSGMLSVAVGVYAWRRRTVPGAAPFAAMELFLGLWALFTAAEIAATTLPTKALYHILERSGALLALSSLLCFAMERTSPSKYALRRRALPVFLVALVILFLMVTNDLHHLVWADFWFDRFIRFSPGPLKTALTGWALFLPTLALILFFRLLLRSHGIFRGQALILFAGSALPLAAYFLEPAGINPVAPLDPVILVQNVSSLLYAVAIFRFGMLEAVPIGRDTAIERMANGVMILDAQNQIVDLNQAAREALELPRGTALGRPADRVLAAYPGLLKLLGQETAASAEITVDGSDRRRYFQVQASPLTHPSGFHLGQVMLLQDVTEQRQAQARILEQQWAQAVLGERELLADELHDSLSQSLAFVSLQAQAAQLYLQGGQSEAGQASLTRLAEVSRQLQGDVRELIGNLLAVSLPSQGFCSALRQAAARFERESGLAVALEVPDGSDEECDATVLPPTTAVQLLRIVQEALANVRQHADHPSQVSLRLAVEADRLHLTIADNGVGFDPALLDPTGRRYGLQVMRQRAARIGGEVVVHSTPGEGTRVEVSAPLRHAPGVGGKEGMTP